AKTRQNQEQTRNVKKSKVKPDKVKAQSKPRENQVEENTTLGKWDVINEDDTTDDEDVFTSYGASVGGGNQLEDEDCDFYEGYVDHVVDLDGALKEFCDFKLSMSSRK
nr:hypothetical protein [Tanacetum cinerariifolium]